MIFFTAWIKSQRGSTLVPPLGRLWNYNRNMPVVFDMNVRVFHAKAVYFDTSICSIWFTSHDVAGM